ncbi:MAG: alpha/beta hydrolase [Rubrivivax sp.]|nr:MAG: alpha/beta hydrolase [Rubrivivax sp.]
MSTWVFLRGLTREQRHWGTFPALFGQQLPGAQVVTLDLPGNGGLHAQSSPPTVEAMAEHCRAALRERGLAPPYHVLAMSLGAMVTVAWASAHPQELAGAVLINTSLRPFSAFHQRLRPRHYGTILRLIIRGAAAEEWERTVLRLTTRQADEPERLIQDWVRFRDDAPVSRANALRQLWAAARFKATAQVPQVPMLILASAQDGLVNPACSRALARHWGCNLVAHPSAGHDLPLDDGEWVARQVCRKFGGAPP